MNSLNKILCVILHYGDESMTWECVESLERYQNLDILIADNDPAQNINIPDKYSDRVNLYRTGGIAGFAHANNQAVQYGRSKEHTLVMLLNNDTIVLNSALDKLINLFDDGEVGMVGPCMPFASSPDTVWACGGVIHKYRVSINGIKSVNKPAPFEVDYLPGAAIICKFDVWDLVGGMPEKYFLAYEEAELALRIQKCNYKIIVHPEAKILHKVGMSSDKQPMYIYNSIRNRIKFGQFLWGKYTGFILASFWTLVGARKSFQKIHLWFRALNDELQSKPLDRSTLLNIRKEFD